MKPGNPALFSSTSQSRGVTLALLIFIGGYAASMSSSDATSSDGLHQTTQSGNLREGWSPHQVDPPMSISSGQLEARPSEDAGVRRFATSSMGYEVVTDEVLVRVRDGVGESDVRSRLAHLEGSVRSWSVRSGLIRVGIPQGTALESFLDTLRHESWVRDAGFNAITTAASCPTGRYDAISFQLDRMSQRDVCEEYDCSILRPVVIALLDTGIAYEDYADSRYSYRQVPELSGVPIVSPWDFVNNDEHANDDNMHGTHLAGLIAGMGEVVGAAPGATLMPVKVLGADRSGTEQALVDGIFYAVDKGADILNLSLSFGLGYYPSPALQDAIAYAASQGVVVVGSVGNGGEAGSSFPGAFQTVIGVSASALQEGNPPDSMMVSMADAIDDPLSDVVAPYANYSYAVDVSGVGGRIDTDFNGDGWPDAPLGPGFPVNVPESIGHWFMAGTSQAAAQVSAEAAWLLAVGLPPGRVRGVLMEGALDIDAKGFDPSTGAGLVEFAPSVALALQDGSEESFPAYFANVTLFLEADVEGKLGAVAVVQVTDKSAQPAAGVMVAGGFYGSVTSLLHTGLTNSSGVAVLRSPVSEVTSDIAIGFHVDGVFSGEGDRLLSRPFGLYSLTPAVAEIFCRVMQDPTAGDSVLLFTLDPQAKATASFLSNFTTHPVLSYLLKYTGPGSVAGPAAVVIDDAFASAVTQATGKLRTKLQYRFDRPLWSGWGEVSKVTLELVSQSAGELGSASRYLFMPFDPSSATVDLAHAYPIVNAPKHQFIDMNGTFGDGLSSSEFVSLFPNSTWGSGFISSTLGDGFISSTLGTGFISSTLGTGFISSTLGTGFISSTLGTGFISSTLGTGFISSTLGTGFISSTLGTSEDSEGRDKSVSNGPTADAGEGLGSLSLYP